MSTATVYSCQARSDFDGKLLTANLIRYHKFYLSNLEIQVYRRLVHLDQDANHSTTTVMH